MEYNADGDAVFDGDAPPVPSASLLEEEEVARGLRVVSCDLATELRAAADVPNEVDARTLRRWAEAAEELNCGVLQYARMATQRASRANVEAAMTENAMFHDVLDREATHVHTLQTLTRLSDGASSELVSGAVARALRVVAQLHTGTATLTSDLPMTYFGADACMAAIEAAAATPAT